ncbi:hypothetical protein K9L04_00295 [Patescibacteria group bacterium]|nr:hypothetical protein [Patescibacteria group bacterium]
MKFIEDNLKEQEYIIFIIKKNYFWLLKYKFIITLFFLFLIAQLIFDFGFENDILNKIIFFIPLFFILFFSFRAYFISKYNSIVITNNRIFNIKQDGFFNRSVSFIFYDDILNISHTISGIFNSIFKCGNISIESKIPENNFIIENIRKPFDIQELINDRVLNIKN